MLTDSARGRLMSRASTCMPRRHHAMMESPASNLAFADAIMLSGNAEPGLRVDQFPSYIPGDVQERSSPILKRHDCMPRWTTLVSVRHRSSTDSWNLE